MILDSGLYFFGPPIYSGSGPPGIHEQEIPGITLFSNSCGNYREFSTFNFFLFSEGIILQFK